MGVETVTRGSLCELMRSLSHKKRNGMLALDFCSHRLRISFHEGKIVGVHDEDQDEVLGICQRLVAAGCVVEKVVTLVCEAGINAAQLYELLVGKEYVTAEDFSRAKNSFTLDLLHSLDELENGSADFQPKLIRAEERQAICVYPGQLLLDVEELRSDKTRLAELSEGIQCVTVSVRDRDATSEHLTIEEQRVFDAASLGCGLQEILQNCLMSQYDVIEALLSLYDQELIEVGRTSAATDVSESSKAEEEIVAENIDSRAEEEQAELPKIESESLESGIHHAALPNKIDTAESDNSSFSFDGQFAAQDPTEQTGPSLETEIETKPLEFSELPASEVRRGRGGLREMIRAGSYHLLNPATRLYLVLGTTTVFLIGFALLGPGMFERWFNALGNFTSK